MDITSVAWPALTAAAGTVTGNRYRQNYDAHHLDPSLPLAVLADGMGDGPGSAFAAHTAVTRLTQKIREATTPHAPAALRAAVAAIHQDVRDSARAHPGLTGCTLTAMLPDADGGAWLIQIGDSRAYRLRNGLLELLTVDHTAAWLGGRDPRLVPPRLTRDQGRPLPPDPLHRPPRYPRPRHSQRAPGRSRRPPAKHRRSSRPTHVQPTTRRLAHRPRPHRSPPRFSKPS